MIISKAQVVDRFDPDRNQSFRAKIESLGGAEKWVKFTSPFSTNGTAGLVGHVPPAGTIVLVGQPDGSSEWFFLAGTFEKEPVGTANTAQDKLTTEVSPSQRVTDISGKSGAGTGVPHRIVLADFLGNTLGLFSEKRGQGDQNIKAEIKSPSGKRIALIDSPHEDSIVIDVGSKTGTSRITMGDDDPQNDRIPANSFELLTTGPQQLLNNESQTDIVVVDGRELQLLNNSTGANAPGGSEKFGNVNIQSKYNDVNIFSQQPYIKESPNTDRSATDGRIFIETLNTDGYHQVIQIQTHGQGHDINDDGVDENTCIIRIKSSGKIEISAAQDIDIKAEGNINMEAGGSINMKSTLPINIASDANVNVGGKQIQLNPPTGVSPTLPSLTEDENYYGNDGVTTY